MWIPTNKLISWLTTSALLLAISQSTQANHEISFDGETAVKELSTGLAGELPAPANVIGTSLINALWPSNSPSTEELLASMDSRLESIDSRLASIREDVRGELEDFYVSRDERTIDATVNYILGQIKIYEDAKLNIQGEQLSTDFLIGEYIDPAIEDISKTMLMYLGDAQLSDDSEMATLPEFLVLSELHIMLLQEKITLLNQENYRCFDGMFCESRLVRLNTTVSQLKRGLDVYIEKLGNISDGVFAKRQDDIHFEATEVWDTKRVLMRDNSIPCPSGGWFCESIRYNTGMSMVVWYDSGASDPEDVLVLANIVDSSFVFPLEQEFEDYLDVTLSEIRAVIDQDIGEIIENYKSIKTNIGKNNVDLLAAECVRFSSPEQQYFEACGPMEVKKFNQYFSNRGVIAANKYTHLWLGSDVAEVQFFSGKNFKGESVALDRLSTRTNTAEIELSEQLGFFPRSFRLITHGSLPVLDDRCVRLFSLEAFRGEVNELCLSDDSEVLKQTLESGTWVSNTSSILVGRQIGVLKLFGWNDNHVEINFDHESTRELPTLGTFNNRSVKIILSND